MRHHACQVVLFVGPMRASSWSQMLSSSDRCHGLLESVRTRSYDKRPALSIVELGSLSRPLVVKQTIRPAVFEVQLPATNDRQIKTNVPRRHTKAACRHLSPPLPAAVALGSRSSTRAPNVNVLPSQNHPAHSWLITWICAPDAGAMIQIFAQVRIVGVNQPLRRLVWAKHCAITVSREFIEPFSYRAIGSHLALQAARICRSD